MDLMDRLADLAWVVLAGLVLNLLWEIVRRVLGWP